MEENSGHSFGNFLGTRPLWTRDFSTLRHINPKVIHFPTKRQVLSSFFFFFLQINHCHSWLNCFKRRGTHARRATHLPRCLFICMIISSCTKEQQQDIWCNTIAGSVPRGAPSALFSKTTGVFNSAVRTVALSATLASRRAQNAASRGCLCV